MPDQPPPLSVRHRLRTATQPRHAVLDTLAGPIHNAAAYHTYLSGIAAFRTGAEQALKAAPRPEILGSWQPQTLTSLLLQDLSDLPLPLPPPVLMTPPDSTAATMGLLYVLEGSTLGARVLVRQANGLGFTGAFGARHLTVQADGLSGWQSFLHCLGQMPDDAIPAAELAAIQTFDAAILAMQAAIGPRP